MVELTASGDADQVEARLGEALDAHGLQLFARIDHAAGARKADVELEPNVLLIFGNTRVGTPLMQADPRVGIELPLRMLIWQDPDGTHVGYLDPRELADRYALDGHQADPRASDRGAHHAGRRRRRGRLSARPPDRTRPAPTGDQLVQAAVALPPGPAFISRRASRRPGWRTCLARI